MVASVSIVRAAEGETLNVLGVAVRFLCFGGDTRHDWSLMENVIPANAGPPPHQHAWDEAYFVIAGEVEFQIGERRERVHAGDFIYAPGGTVHAFHGVSQVPARMLIFDIPAHPEAFFKELHREVTEVPRDLLKLPAIGARHGLLFVAGPESESAGYINDSTKNEPDVSSPRVD